MKHYNVVAALVKDGERVLCVQKGITRYSYTTHMWEFPGGKIEPGETPQQALKRELKEEMNFDIEVKGLVATVEHTYPDFSITMQAYLCAPMNMEFELKEHIASRWCTVEEMLRLDWCEADKPIVEALG